MSDVIYARVPTDLKDALDTYAGARAITLTAAVVDLMQRGLESVANADSVDALQAQVTELSARLALTEGQLQSAQSQVASVGAFNRRAQQTVGQCPMPECGQPVSGHDLLIVGACGACGHSLGGLLAPQDKSSLNQRDVMILLGALGAALAVATWSMKGTV